MMLNEKFSNEVKEIIRKSQIFSKAFTDNFIRPEFVFQSILSRYSVPYINDISNLDSNDLVEYIRYRDLDRCVITIGEKLNSDKILNFNNPSDFSDLFARMSESCEYALDFEMAKIIDYCEIEASSLNRELITTDILFLSILKYSSKVAKIMEDFNVSYSDTLEFLNKKKFKQEMIKNEFPDPGLDSQLETAGPSLSSNIPKKRGKISTETPFLEQYSFNMNKGAKEGKFDPVVGRENELNQLIEILSCRKKNNALLLGDPGVGKTSIIEMLAQRIQDKQVPKYLLEKKIYTLDLTALVSGTKYRGQYEERLQGIINEVVSHPEIIIYIDEFHNLMGNGSSDGKGDGANILKPYLARGEFQCIGSTTVEEYRKFVEKDGALKRRFQNVMIDQPSMEETKTILENIKEKYQDYHHVKYSTESIEKCVEWTGRYVTDRFFPDKAIDALDLSGSITKLAQPSNVEKIKELQNRLDEIRQIKINLVKEETFDEASKYLSLQKEVAKELEKEMNVEIEPSLIPTVDKDIVAKVIQKISGVPIESIEKSDMDKLRGMKKILESNVIGQDEAIDKVIKSLQRNSLGLRDPKKPIASLLMVGPTGSGKTYLCKTLAKEFFGSEEALIKFDMSEFGEKHEITKLLGSTASYVGYDDTPLFDQIRRKPYSVVLFDEIEKAAKEIYQIFLSILDEGIVTLGNGTKVNFKNTIIIFTGNVGTKELKLHGDGIGFKSKKTKEDDKKEMDSIVTKAVEKTFAPEFINRLSEIIIFNKLGVDELNDIFDLELNKLQIRLKEKNYIIEVTKELKDFIVSKCNLQYGARDLQRNLVKYIEDEICKKLLEENFDGKTNIKANYVDDSIEITLS